MKAADVDAHARRLIGALPCPPGGDRPCVWALVGVDRGAGPVLHGASASFARMVDAAVASLARTYRDADSGDDPGLDVVDLAHELGKAAILRLEGADPLDPLRWLTMIDARGGRRTFDGVEPHPYTPLIRDDLDELAEGAA